eukprot:1208331-Amorphochlora_amoeboformis.AAC.1
MEILEIVRRLYHPVVPGSTRWYPLVTGFRGTVTKRDVTGIIVVTSRHVMPNVTISTLFVCSQE